MPSKSAKSAKKLKTRHLVVSVTANMVDITDSGIQGIPTINMPNSPAVWIQTRPCPLCVGIWEDDLTEKRKTELLACLTDMFQLLGSMLGDGSKDIIRQAAGWTL